MAWFNWPDLSTGKWMCLEPCEHTDCAAWREKSKKPCPLCGELFQAGRQVTEHEGQYVHFSCLLDKIDQRLPLTKNMHGV